MKTLWNFLKELGGRFSEDKLPKLAAALAYYSSFALAPILVIAVAVAGLIFGVDEARTGLLNQVQGLIGESSTKAIGQVLDRLREPQGSLMASIIGGIALLFGASGVFGELQDSLNIIWRVKKKEGRGVWGALKDRFFSFSMVLGVGFLLLVSLVVSAVLAALGHWIGASEGGWLLQIASVAASLLIVTALFALMFKYLPDAETRWKHVAIGGAVTAVLFALGKFGIGLYLAKSSVNTTYGAASAFLIILLWVYYSSQIFFLGAAVTHTLAVRQGPKPKPDVDATPAEPFQRPKAKRGRQTTTLRS
jgi:membrane protein